MPTIKISKLRAYVSFLTPSILKRDSYKCQLCGSEKDLETHHIQSVKDHPFLILKPTNLITLCHECHFVKAHLHNSKRMSPEIQYQLSIIADALELENPTELPDSLKIFL